MASRNDYMEIIKTSSLVKNYNGIKAVDNVSIKVSKGEIFGLLGPNGAGKTNPHIHACDHAQANFRKRSCQRL